MNEIEKAIGSIGIKKIFLQTDTFAPAYEFYKKRGFIEEKGHVSFSKEI